MILIPFKLLIEIINALWAADTEESKALADRLHDKYVDEKADRDGKPE